MKRNFIILFMIVFVGTLFAQDVPPTVTNRPKLARWVRAGTFTFTNKTLTSPTITDPSISGTTAFTGAITLSSTFIQTTTSAVVTGTVRSMTINQTHTGDGAAILEALRVNIASAVQTGSWANAIVGRIAYSGAAGDAGGGMAAAICAEIVLPAIASPAGQYFAIDLEFNAPTTYEGNAGTSFPTAYIRFGLYGNGTAVASFEDDAYFLQMSTEFTSASGNMWYNNTLRVQLEATDFFIALSDAEGEYSSAYMIDISNATDASSTTTGSIQTDGGLGVVLKAYFGSDVAVDGTSNLDDVDIDGNVNLTGAVLAAAADNALIVTATTSITTGSNYAVEINHTNTAGSAANLAGLFATTTAGANGAGFMGIMSRVDMSTYTCALGGANALYGEILLPNAAQGGGEYHVAVLTLAESGAGFVPGSSVTLPTSFIKFETWGGAAEHMDDYTYLYYLNGFTAAAGHMVSLTSQTVRVNIGKVARYMVLSQMQDGLGLGVTGTRMVLTASTDQAIEVFTTSPTSTGNHWANALYHQNSVTTTGTQGVLWVENDVVAQAAGQNAAYFKIDMNAIQAPTGGVSVLNLELVMPTGTQNGGVYSAFVIDIDCPATTDLVYNAALPISFMKLEVYGDKDDEWNETANLFYLSGIVDTDGGLFDLESITGADFNAVLRINVGGTPYYIGLNSSKAF